MHSALLALIVTLVNSQEVVPTNSFNYIKETFRGGINVKVEIENAPYDKNRLPTGKEGFLIKVVDSEDCPFRTTVAPDDGVVTVNVRKLKPGASDQKTIERRVFKSIWRGFVYAMGGGNTMTPPCPMKPCVTLEDLDALNSCCPSPEVFDRVQRGCEKRGITFDANDVPGEAPVAKGK